MDWICPHCAQPLTQTIKHWTCDNGHSFDVAKQGYVNLLNIKDKNSKQPGDNKAMIQARRRFLSSDHFAPLVTALLPLYSMVPPNSDCLDIGCGEGHYIKCLQSALPHINWQGCDISKEAIKLAAKSCSAQFIVASNRHLPVATQCVDGVLQIFAPAFPAEVRRILKPDGHWVRVTPGPDHLKELRAIIYPTAKAHARAEIPEGFSVKTETKIQETLSLTTPEQIQDLLMMTPYQWHGNQQAKENLGQQTTFDVTLDFLIEQLTLAKPSDAPNGISRDVANTIN